MSESNVPALRFPNFLGEWNKVKLLEMSSLITKGTTPKNFVAEGINFIKIECFVGSTINKDKCLFIDEKTHAKELKRSVLQEGDILFAIAGATIGKCSVVTRDILPANTNQALAIIRLKDQKSLSFVYNNLRSDLMQKYILDNMSVGAQPNLNLEQMGNFSFFLPSLLEQQKIASFLTAIDAKIELLAKKKTLLEQYKKGVMQQLFSQQIRFKDDEGYNFPDWEKKTLEEILERSSSKYNPEKDKTNYMCIELESIEQGTGNILNTFDSNSQKSIKNKFVKGEILFGKLRPYLRKFYRATFNGVCSSEIWVLRGTKVSNDFLYYLVQTDGFIAATNVTSGSKMPRAEWNQIVKILVEYPSLSEQNKITSFLNSIDAKISQIQTQVEGSKEFKNGLLQQLFV